MHYRAAADQGERRFPTPPLKLRIVEQWIRRGCRQAIQDHHVLDTHAGCGQRDRGPRGSTPLPIGVCSRILPEGGLVGVGVYGPGSGERECKNKVMLV